MSPPLARMLFALGACALLGGCQSTVGSLLSQNTTNNQTPAAKAPVLVQGTQFDWSLTTNHDAPGLIKSGRAIVAPDGSVALGPYGSCKVGGLTVAQANKAVEKHVSAFVKGPTVAISVQTPEGVAQDVAWRPAKGVKPAGQPGPIQTVSANTGPTLFPPTKTEPAAPVAKPAISVAKKDGGAKRVVFQPANGNGKDDKPVAKKTDTIPMPREFQPGGHDVLMVTPGAGGHVPVPLGPAPDELKRVLLPPYVIGPPDVLQIEALLAKKTAPVRGPHLVQPDGTVRLGVYGTVTVAGLTLDQAKDVIARAIHAQMRQLKPLPQERDKKDEADEGGYTLKDVYEYLSVDVLAFNSKTYYVITDNAGQGEVVTSLPYTGNETVLDAIAKINGLPPVASKRHIWVARRTRPDHPAQVYPVNWVAITQGGETDTNWQIFPGDRIYVKADHWYTTDRNLAKVLSPIERIFGVTLLGSNTVNSIRNGGRNNGNNNNNP